MASIQTSGVNLDVQSLATQLVAADRATEDARLQRQEQKLSVQMSGLGTLKGALSSFQNTLEPLKKMSAFQVRSATVSNEETFSATATEKAAPGTYDIEVVALAKANQISSIAYAGNDTAIGTGTLTIGQGSSSFDVTVDSSHNTLAGIRDAINANVNNTGVQATLIHEANGTHIVLTSTKTGAANALSVSSAGGDGGLSALNYSANNHGTLTELQPAQDAHIKLAGQYDHFSTTNDIDGVIDGVTISLSKTTDPGTTESLTVNTDNSKIVENVQSFVTAFNALQKAFSTLRSYNADTGAKGALFGDALLRQVEDQVRSDLSNTVPGVEGDYNSLAAIGITRQLDGTLGLDETKLKAAMATGNNTVANVFGSENGIAARLDAHIEDTLKTGAALDYRNTSITAGLKDLSTRKDALDARMVLQQQRYIKQFSALDAMLSSMQQTSNYLAQQLGSGS